MRRSIVWSAALHILVLVLAIVGLPRLWKDAKLNDHPVVVEVVNIDEQTTAKEMPKPAEKKKKEPKKAPPPPEPPKAKPFTEPPPPEPPKVAERPEPKAEKVPIKPKPEPKKAPEKKEKAEKKKPEPKPPKPPPEFAKARPRHKPPEPKEDFLQSVLRDVSPEERAPQRQEKPKKTEPASTPEKETPRKAPLDAVVTTSEIDAIRHAIEQCWNIPAGARDAENLVVTIRVWLNPDGTVRDARLDKDIARMGSDPFFRAAAESAMRAVLNQRCQPLPIPPKKYDQFKNLVLEFNPKTAAGS